MAEQDKFQGLAQAVALNPHDTQIQLQYVDALRQGGADNRAKTYLKSFLKQNPDSGVAYLELALLDSGQKSQISRRAAGYLQKALQLGLPTPGGQAYAHQLLGKYYLDRNESELALNEVNAALGVKIVGEETAVTRHKAALYHLRSQVHRRRKQYDLAFRDIQQAIILAQQIGDNTAVAHYRQERDIVETHAGYKPSDSPFTPQ